VVDPEGAPPRRLSLPPDGDTLAGGLRLVIDPELGVSIVDLGLVYRAEVVDGVARVLMTGPASCSVAPNPRRPAPLKD
jgi:metal-sulfur cluster biosynthetic enzyme